jgi:hypothetical protein
MKEELAEIRVISLTNGEGTCIYIYTCINRSRSQFIFIAISKPYILWPQKGEQENSRKSRHSFRYSGQI